VSRHFAAKVLAVYIEGEVRPRKAAKISAHLPGCTLCSGVVGELRRVPTLLASVPAPPLPGSLSVRIEVALRSESSARVASEPATEGGRGEIQARRPRARRRWQAPRLSSPLASSLVAAAAAVIVAGGGYVLATHVTAPSATSSSSAVHAPSTFGAAAPQAAERVRFGPAVVYREAGQKHSVYSVETGTDYQPATLSTQARTALSDASASNLSYAQHALTAPNEGQPLAKVDLPKLEACVSNVASGQNVLLVDVAEFQGKSATIIVVGLLPGGQDVVYAVGPACSATSKDILARQYLPRV